MKVLIMKLFLVSHNFLPLKPKYLPEHSVLEHPQHIFLLSYKRPGLTFKQSKNSHKSFLSVKEEYRNVSGANTASISDLSRIPFTCQYMRVAIDVGLATIIRQS
jgi:hypothetical protein